MNTRISLIVNSLLLILFLTSVMAAQDSTKNVSKVTPGAIEKSLLEGVKSDNEGLRISSAYYLGENKSKAAVIPLMSMLKSESSSPAEKIMAALSLFKIKDERGIYAIKSAIEYEDSPEVVKMCKIFYDLHLQKGK